MMPAILALLPCDSARLALEPQLFFEDVGAAQPLLVNHRLGVFGRGADLRVVQAILPLFGAVTPGLPVAERLAE